MQQVLRQEHGSVTSRPFRKLCQTDQPTDRPTDGHEGSKGSYTSSKGGRQLYQAGEHPLYRVAVDAVAGDPAGPVVVVVRPERLEGDAPRDLAKVLVGQLLLQRQLRDGAALAAAAAIAAALAVVAAAAKAATCTRVDGVSHKKCFFICTYL